MKKILYIAAMFCIFAVSVNAQDKYTKFTYNMGYGMGDTYDFMEAGSYRGFEFSFGQFVLDDKISVGIDLGFQNFYDEIPKRTEEFEGGAITAKQYRYLYTVPILAVGNYYPLGQETKVVPFVGLGVGTYYVERQNDFGLYGTSIKSWHFGLAPELGISIPINYSVNFDIGAKYNMAFETSDADAENWLGVNVGFRFLF